MPQIQQYVLGHSSNFGIIWGHMQTQHARLVEAFIHETKYLLAGAWIYFKPCVHSSIQIWYVNNSEGTLGQEPVVLAMFLPLNSCRLAMY